MLTRMKAGFFRFFYKTGVFMKPLLVKVLPLATRQKIKMRLVKSAFPMIKSDLTIKGSKGQQLLNGINLIGYSRAEMGIGESCRIAAKNLAAGQIPFEIINFKGMNSARMSDLTWVHKEVEKPSFIVNLFHLNAEQMVEVYANFGGSLFEGRYSIGYWHWELPDFPDDWMESFRMVNEIWVPSTFVADSVAMKSPVPVVKIPHSVEVVITEHRNRSYFSLPDNAFLFCFMYDMKSHQERKNPQASIRAFTMSFRPEDMSVGLVIKVNGAQKDAIELEEIYELIGVHRNIYLIVETLSRNDVNCLISLIDCFVSLHRSEGFGLGLAEAMYLGKPTIGTNWSSNVDFMNHDNSCLVDYKLQQLGQNYGPYKAYQYWAEADVEHASWYMKKLVEDKDYCRKIAVLGQQHIQTYYSPQAIGKLIKKRLDYISMWNYGGKNDNHLRNNGRR